jgi:hypothetical protein
LPLAVPGEDPISGGAGDAGADPGALADAGSDDADALDDGTMTFFVTSTGMGDGGNLGGLVGADALARGDQERHQRQRELREAPELLRLMGRSTPRRPPPMAAPASRPPPTSPPKPMTMANTTLGM